MHPGTPGHTVALNSINPVLLRCVSGRKACGSSATSFKDGHTYQTAPKRSNVAGSGLSTGECYNKIIEHLHRNAETVEEQ